MYEKIISFFLFKKKEINLFFVFHQLEIKFPHQIE